MEILLGLATAIGFLLLWLSILAIYAITHDALLNRLQKSMQFIFVLVIPFIGSTVVLHIIYEHSPNLIPRRLIPWPFKNIICGPAIKPNRDRDDNLVDGVSGSLTGRHTGNWEGDD